MDEETEQPGSSAVIAAHFIMKNITRDTNLVNVRLNFVESFDFRYLGDKRHPHIASASDVFGLDAGEETEAVGYFEVLGDMRRDLYIRGDLQYDVQVQLLYPSLENR